MTIKKVYRVESEKNKRNLGEYPSKALAEKRLEQIKAFKKNYIKK